MSLMRKQLVRVVVDEFKSGRRRRSRSSLYKTVLILKGSVGSISIFRPRNVSTNPGLLKSRDMRRLIKRAWKNEE